MFAANNFNSERRVCTPHATVDLSLITFAFRESNGITKAIATIGNANIIEATRYIFDMMISF
jgi:hypothetical protein